VYTKVPENNNHMQLRCQQQASSSILQGEPLRVSTALLLGMEVRPRQIRGEEEYDGNSSLWGGGGLCGGGGVGGGVWGGGVGGGGGGGLGGGGVVGEQYVGTPQTSEAGKEVGRRVDDQRGACAVLHIWANLEKKRRMPRLGAYRRRINASLRIRPGDPDGVLSQRAG